MNLVLLITACHDHSIMWVKSYLSRIFFYCSWCDSLTAGSQVLNTWCECFDFFSKQEESFTLCYKVASKTAIISGNGQLSSITIGIPHFTTPLRTFLFYRVGNQLGECTSCLVCLLANAKDLSREKHITLTQYANLTSLYYFWPVSAK